MSAVGMIEREGRTQCLIPNRGQAEASNRPLVACPFSAAQVDRFSTLLKAQSSTAGEASSQANAQGHQPAQTAPDSANATDLLGQEMAEKTKGSVLTRGVWLHEPPVASVPKLQPDEDRVTAALVPPPENDEVSDSKLNFKDPVRPSALPSPAKDLPTADPFLRCLLLDGTRVAIPRSWLRARGAGMEAYFADQQLAPADAGYQMAPCDVSAWSDVVNHLGFGSKPVQVTDLLIDLAKLWDLRSMYQYSSWPEPKESTKDLYTVCSSDPFGVDLFLRCLLVDGKRVMIPRSWLRARGEKVEKIFANTARYPVDAGYQFAPFGVETWRDIVLYLRFGIIPPASRIDDRLIDAEYRWGLKDLCRGDFQHKANVLWSGKNTVAFSVEWKNLEDLFRFKAHPKFWAPSNACFKFWPPFQKTGYGISASRYGIRLEINSKESITEEILQPKILLHSNALYSDRNLYLFKNDYKFVQQEDCWRTPWLPWESFYYKNWFEPLNYAAKNLLVCSNLFVVFGEDEATGHHFKEMLLHRLHVRSDLKSD